MIRVDREVFGEWEGTEIVCNGASIPAVLWSPSVIESLRTSPPPPLVSNRNTKIPLYTQFSAFKEFTCASPESPVMHYRHRANGR